MMARLWMGSGHRTRTVLGSLILAAASVAMLTVPSFASAREAPRWKIVSVSSPTNLVKPANGEEPTNELIVTAVNVGGVATDGSAITITDTLPQGLTAKSITGEDNYAPLFSFLGLVLEAEKLECSEPPELTCKRTAVEDPGDQLVVKIQVAVEPGAPSSVINSATVSGGGAEEAASVNNPATISATPAAFGFAPGSVFTSLSTRQAGAHPDVTSGFTLNTAAAGVSAADPRDVRFDLPPGLVGNTVGMPRCTANNVVREPQNCPRDTMVGMAVAEVELFGSRRTAPSAVYNIAPSPGEPAAFMFKVFLFGVRLDTSVLSNGDYASWLSTSLSPCLFFPPM
jgi:hypothetical protein